MKLKNSFPQIALIAFATFFVIGAENMKPVGSYWFLAGNILAPFSALALSRIFSERKTGEYFLFCIFLVVVGTELNRWVIYGIINEQDLSFFQKISVSFVALSIFVIENFIFYLAHEYYKKRKRKRLG